jgi:hypothetical protein
LVKISEPTATTLVKISGDDGQQGVINTALGNPFVVEVRDGNDNPFLGSAVTFAVTAGGGTLGTTSTTTVVKTTKRGNEHGLCVCRWDFAAGDFYRRGSDRSTASTAASANGHDAG